MDVPESQESTDNTKSELNPQDGDDNFHGLLPGLTLTYTTTVAVSNSVDSVWKRFHARTLPLFSLIRQYLEKAPLAQCL